MSKALPDYEPPAKDSSSLHGSGPPSIGHQTLHTPCVACHEARDVKEFSCPIRHTNYRQMTVDWIVRKSGASSSDIAAQECPRECEKCQAGVWARKQYMKWFPVILLVLFCTCLILLFLNQKKVDRWIYKILIRALQMAWMMGYVWANVLILVL